ncbi:MAG: GMC family oxidoreductase N-terminal domain-containing protein [Amaricoccus sp.]|uniref:GMC family oxidoreductase n=1 Tax=Amaricoccus sp. TaxID=1872485 RepID=UPI0039E3A4AE
MAEAYDYIVVGAGSSGAVVASRLSEDPATKVLLVEAGGETDDFWINMPAGIGKLFASRKFNWYFHTEPDPGVGGRKIYWPRGKGLGGTSCINGMIYMRGQPCDFDRWRDLGNEGWGWDDVLPYFIRSEANQQGANTFHGSNGPLSVTDPEFRHPTSDDFIAAAVNAGIPRVDDLNSSPLPGVAYRQYTIRNGRRHSTYKAFLEPVRQRANLKILTDAHVCRVLFEGDEATGIEVQQGGARREILAAREVVLSGGAFGSPQILMLSGIGDPAMLARQGIEARLDLPGVGQNLQDHWHAVCSWRSTEESSYNARLRGIGKYLEGIRYLLTRSGCLAIGASPVSAYIRSGDDRAEADIQLAFSAMTYVYDASGNPVIDPLPGVNGSMVLLTPDSRGHMELASADPLQAPLFHPNYLSDPRDIERSLIGLRMLRKITETAPLSARIVSEISPGANVTSDDQWLDYLKAKGNSAWHPVGTCKMGNDPMAVVDARLRVRGVRRLRVADASIMPLLVAGNTNAPCIMIGEKGADMIRQDAAPRRPGLN